MSQESRAEKNRFRKVWRGMIQRCTNTKHKAYKYYGARGITVCKRWTSSFHAFVKDMGIRPAGMTLERKNNSKGYYKSNCKWATMTEQAGNRRPYGTLSGRQDQMPSPDTLAGRIKLTRLERGYSQSAFCKRTGIAPSSMCRIEGGYRGVGILTLNRIAIALDVTLDYLLHGKPTNNKKAKGKK